MVRLFIIIIIIICKKLTFKSNNQDCLPNLNNTIFTWNSADFIYDLTWPAAICRTPYFRTKFGVLKTRHMGEDLRYIKCLFFQHFWVGFLYVVTFTWHADTCFFCTNVSPEIKVPQFTMHCHLKLNRLPFNQIQISIRSEYISPYIYLPFLHLFASVCKPWWPSHTQTSVTFESASSVDDVLECPTNHRPCYPSSVVVLSQTWSGCLHYVWESRRLGLIWFHLVTLKVNKQTKLIWFHLVTLKVNKKTN